MSRNTSKVVGRAGHGVGILLILFFTLFPIVWITLTAFKPDRYMFTSDLAFPPTLSNFTAIFSPPLNFGPLALNSVIVALGTIIIAIPISVMAAYVFSRHAFPGVPASWSGFWRLNLSRASSWPSPTSTCSAA